MGQKHKRGLARLVDGLTFWPSMIALLVGLLWADLSNPGSAVRVKLADLFALFDAKPAWSPMEGNLLHIRTGITIRKKLTSPRVHMIVYRRAPTGDFVHDFTHKLGEGPVFDRHEDFEYTLGSFPIEGNHQPKWCNERSILGQGKYIIVIRVTARRRFKQSHKIYVELLSQGAGTLGRFFLLDQNTVIFDRKEQY